MNGVNESKTAYEEEQARIAEERRLEEERKAEEERKRKEESDKRKIKSIDQAITRLKQLPEVIDLLERVDESKIYFDEMGVDEESYGINIRILAPDGLRTTSWGFYSIKSDGSIYKMNTLAGGHYELIY